MQFSTNKSMRSHARQQQLVLRVSSGGIGVLAGVGAMAVGAVPGVVGAVPGVLSTSAPMPRLNNIAAEYSVVAIKSSSYHEMISNKKYLSS